MKKFLSFLFCFMPLLVFSQGYTNLVSTNFFTAVAPDGNADIGTVQEGVDWFLAGLEWGSGLAAVLFGFITVRRALSMGDAWND